VPTEIYAVRRPLEPVEKAATQERQRKHAALDRAKHSGKVSTNVESFHQC
jgi:hypothetical protein